MIYTSPFAPVPPERVHHGGIFDFLFHRPAARDFDSRPALIDALTGKTTTYAELRDESLSFADGLARVAGLKRRDTVLLFSPNSTLYPTLLLAGQAAGLVVSTANAAYTADELQHQLEVSEASVVLASADLLETTATAAERVGLGLDRVFVLPDAKGAVPDKLPHGMRSFEELRGSKSFKPVIPTFQEAKTDIAYLPFSSGTTGKGKGVALSAYNATMCIQQVQQTPGTGDRADTVLSILPLSHIFGLIVMFHLTIYNGGTLVILPKFVLKDALEAIQRYKCTTALIVPPIVLLMAKEEMVEEYDLSSLRYMLSGAAPLSHDLQQAVSRRLNLAMVQGYGMSETTSVGLTPEVLEPVVPGAAGRLLSSMEARLVNSKGKDVKEGEAGELWLRGPNIMLRYHKNEKATRETLTKDGWLMTGDVCERNPEGHFFVVDRVKELIKYKGFQVAPAEYVPLNGCLLSAPFIADAAVIGIYSDEQATELPRAYIVPAPSAANSSTLVEDVKKWVEEKLAPHKRLRGGVVILDAIPKSPSGKILRKDLRVLAAKETKKERAKL
ncbi:hypothetical protein JCM10207_004812 [Rhodosporidiobolus poonsookiae]